MQIMLYVDGYRKAWVTLTRNQMAALTDDCRVHVTLETDGRHDPHGVFSEVGIDLDPHVPPLP